MSAVHPLSPTPAARWLGADRTLPAMTPTNDVTAIESHHVVLDVRAGSMQIWSATAYQVGTTVNLTIGSPVFATPQRIGLHVSQVLPAAEQRDVLRDSPFVLPPLTSGYLVLLDFVVLTAAQQQALATYVQSHPRDRHIPRERGYRRTMQLGAIRARPRDLIDPAVPTWAYLLGIGISILLTCVWGLRQLPVQSWVIAVTTTLALSWLMGRGTLILRERHDVQRAFADLLGNAAPSVPSSHGAARTDTLRALPQRAAIAAQHDIREAA